ncbi:uncharacterized protein A1O5_05768 [Cladophialophora psammophila CBS 110553]|uniref:Uncharacterized protein n=1 Tax=Cladophialophora psammophila CBS 110553 TaxID=1182543 RepID=W9WS63_9EURO|nr:uncharacterized protein A1O5_05768 [Cladophialophora psammophila CBS 110553]EXJ70778.1 hypothetical protein A1O5_05768 [Cladophialophora psammophila CBS 110553]
MQVTQYDQLSQHYGQEIVFAISRTMQEGVMSNVRELPGYGTMTSTFSIGGTGTSTEQVIQAAIGHEKLFTVFDTKLREWSSQKNANATEEPTNLCL